jgi:hypothetical protein
MKIKKLVALVIILIAVAAIAVIYFSLQKSDDNSIEITTVPFDQYLQNSPNNYDNQNYSGSLETTFETIYQNMILRNGTANNFYSLFVQEDFGKEKGTNRLVYTDMTLMEKLGLGNPDFFVLETKVENEKIVRKLESSFNSSIHTVELADFWILEKGTDPKIVISLLISSTDPEACEVDVQELDSQAGGTVPGRVQYQILFKPENLSIEKLNNYKNISADNFCGKYGPKKNYGGYVDNGVFLFHNDVLVYVDADSPWRWVTTYDTTKVIHR